MYKILIADDEEYVRNLVIKNLSATDLDIQILPPAANGQEALEIALKNLPDILITDISMPVLNGLELIKQLQERNIHVKSVIISGYDQFDYAKTAVSLGVTEYLLKPFTPKGIVKVLEQIIQELDGQKALQKNLSILKRQADLGEAIARQEQLQKLLLGEKSEKTEKEKAEILGIQPEANCFATGLVVIQKGSSGSLNSEQIEEFTLLIRQKYFLDDIQVLATRMHENRLAFLFCGTGLDEQNFLQEIMQGIRKIVTSLKNYYDITINISIGKYCRTLGEVPHSWQSALVLWRGKYNGQKSILMYGENEGLPETLTNAQIHNEIKENKKMIRYAVCDGRDKDVQMLFTKLMKCYAMLPFQKTDYIVASLEELLFDIGNDLEYMDCHQAPEKVNTIKKIIEHESLFEIDSIMRTYIHECCELVQNYGERQRGNLQSVKQAIRYIDDHLQDSDLSAELLAKKLIFSTSYFRQIFRENMKESFNEYLIRIRMEKAGELLKSNHDIKIQNLSEACGYENQRYFASSFKKFYGCTPTEYKEGVIKKFIL